MRILWFRRDLRLEDSEIISLGATNNSEVLPCIIIDPWFYHQAEVGKARVKFLFESLEYLDSNLRSRGSHLYLFEGNSISVLQELTNQLLQKGDRPKLFFNHDVDELSDEGNVRHVYVHQLRYFLASWGAALYEVSSRWGVSNQSVSMADAGRNN